MKDIPNDFTEIYIIIREDCQQLYVNKLDNEDDMDIFFKKNKKVVTETDLRKIEKFNIPTTNEPEVAIGNLPIKVKLKPTWL